MALDASTGQFRATLTANPTANRVITFPDATDTVAVLNATQSLAGKTLVAPILLGALSSAPFAANQDITANGQTITLPNATTEAIIKQINPTAARTGTILTAGTVNGQILVLLNIAAAANTNTFAVEATSNVANGVTCVMRGREAAVFFWSSGQARWFPVFV